MSRRHRDSAQPAEKTNYQNRRRQHQENIVDINAYRKLKQRVTLLPKNLEQETFIEALENPTINIVFAVGAAGTGKTYLSTLYAIQCLKAGAVDKIVVTRPNVALDDRDIGFLPGNILQKMSPWTRPIFDVFEEYFSVKEIAGMVEENVIELVPLAYMRGRTFKNAIIILDEAQNTTKNSMMGALTRLGEGSKMIVTGDTRQTDRGEHNGLQDFVDRYEQSRRIQICYFGHKDIERHPVVGEILKIYKEE